CRPVIMAARPSSSSSSRLRMVACASFTSTSVAPPSNNPAMAALTSDVNIGRHRCHSGAPGSQSAGQVTPVAPSMSAEMRIFTWSEADADVLHFDVFLDPLTPALAAEPGRLDPAERCRRGGDDPRVQADHAELERLG